MEINDIIKYVSQTPENTNPAVLKDMLKQINNNTDTSDNMHVHMVRATYNNELERIVLSKNFQEIWDIYTTDDYAFIVIYGAFEGEEEQFYPDILMIDTVTFMSSGDSEYIVNCMHGLEFSSNTNTGPLCLVQTSDHENF